MGGDTATSCFYSEGTADSYADDQGSRVTPGVLAHMLGRLIPSVGKVQERPAWWRPSQVCGTADGRWGWPRAVGRQQLESVTVVQTGDKSWGTINIETQARRLDKASQEFRRGQAKAEQGALRHSAVRQERLE